MRMEPENLPIRSREPAHPVGCWECDSQPIPGGGGGLRRAAGPKDAEAACRATADVADA